MNNGSCFEGTFPFKTDHQVGEMAQWAKCLTLRHEDLGFIPSTHIKVRCLRAHDSSAGEVVRVILAKSTRSRFKDPVSKNKMESNRRR